VSGATSACSLAKSLGIDGYWRVSDWLYRQVSRYWGSLYISNNPQLCGVYRYVPCSRDALWAYDTKLRYSSKYHRLETPIHLVAPTVEPKGADAWWHLQDSLVKLSLRGEQTIGSRDEDYTVPHRERSQRGWSDTF
jgi:hypothetical protein